MRAATAQQHSDISATLTSGNSWVSWARSALCCHLFSAGLTGPLENSDMGPEAPSLYQSCSAPLPTPGNRPSSQMYFNILVMGASNLGKTRFISDLARACTLEKSDVLLDVTSSEFISNPENLSAVLVRALRLPRGDPPLSGPR